MSDKFIFAGPHYPALLCVHCLRLQSQSVIINELLVYYFDYFCVIIIDKLVWDWAWTYLVLKISYA